MNLNKKIVFRNNLKKKLGWYKPKSLQNRNSQVRNTKRKLVNINLNKKLSLKGGASFLDGIRDRRNNDDDGSSLTKHKDPSGQTPESPDILNKNNPKYEKYFRMINTGVRFEAVQGALRMEGFKEFVLDYPDLTFENSKKENEKKLQEEREKKSRVNKPKTKQTCLTKTPVDDFRVNIFFLDDVDTEGTIFENLCIENRNSEGGYQTKKKKRNQYKNVTKINKKRRQQGGGIFRGDILPGVVKKFFLENPNSISPTVLREATASIGKGFIVLAKEAYKRGSQEIREKIDGLMGDIDWDAIDADAELDLKKNPDLMNQFVELVSNESIPECNDCQKPNDESCMEEGKELTCLKKKNPEKYQMVSEIDALLGSQGGKDITLSSEEKKTLKKKQGKNKFWNVYPGEDLNPLLILHKSNKELFNKYKTLKQFNEFLSLMNYENSEWKGGFERISDMYSNLKKLYGSDDESKASTAQENFCTKQEESSNSDGLKIDREDNIIACGYNKDETVRHLLNTEEDLKDIQYIYFIDDNVNNSYKVGQELEKTNKSFKVFWWDPLEEDTKKKAILYDRDFSFQKEYKSALSRFGVTEEEQEAEIKKYEQHKTKVNTASSQDSSQPRVGKLNHNRLEGLGALLGKRRQ
jgi:hypothetical protein